jgi:hypothetical protein
VPTLTIIDGFTHGSNASGAAGVYSAILGTPDIVTTPARTGGSGQIRRINPSAGTEMVQYTPAAGNRQIAISFYIRFATLPAANVMLAAFLNANGTPYLRYYQTTGQFGVVNTLGGSTVPTGPVVAVNTWYLIDLLCDTSTGTQSIKLRVDGADEVEFTRAQTAADITGVFIGTNSTGTYEAFYSDWVGSYTTADYPLGEHHIEQLLPTADGTHSISGANIIERGTSGTDITNGTTDAYTLVDDATLDLAFTTPDFINMVGNSTASYTEHTFADLASGTDEPADVWGYSTDKDSTGTGAALAVTRVIYDAAATWTDLRVTGDDPGITATARKKILVRPSGGSWSRTLVNGIAARFGFADGAPDAYLGSIMVEVALFPGGPSAVTLTVATMALTAVTLTPTPGQVTVTLTPASMVLTAVAVSPAPVPGAVTLTPASLPLTAVAVTPVPQPVMVTLTPAVLPLAAVSVTPVPQPVTVSLTPATVALTAVPVSAAPVGAGAVTLTPAVIALTGVAVTPVPQPVTITLTPSLITLTPVAVTATPGQVTTPLTPAVLSLTAVALQPGAGASEVTLTAAVLSITARPVTPSPQPVTVALTAAVIVLTSVPVTGAPGQVTTTLSPAVLVVAAVPLTPGAIGLVTLAPALMALAAVALSPAMIPLYTPAFVSVDGSSSSTTLDGSTVTAGTGLGGVTTAAGAM